VVLFCPAGEEPAGLLVGTPEPPAAGPSVVVPFVPLLIGAGVFMICGGARAGAVTAFLLVSAFDRNYYDCYEGVYWGPVTPYFFNVVLSLQYQKIHDGPSRMGIQRCCVMLALVACSQQTLQQWAVHLHDERPAVAAMPVRHEELLQIMKRGIGIS